MQITRKSRIEFRFPRAGWYRAWADYDYDYAQDHWYAANTCSHWFKLFGHEFKSTMTEQEMMLMLIKYSNSVDQK